MSEGIFSVFDISQPSWKPGTSEDAHNCIVLRGNSQKYDDQSCFNKNYGALCQFKR